MSDWKESDCEVVSTHSTECDTRRARRTYFSGNDEGDGFDGARGDLEAARDLAVRHAEAAAREEAHATLGVR